MIRKKAEHKQEQSDKQIENQNQFEMKFDVGLSKGKNTFNIIKDNFKYESKRLSSKVYGFALVLACVVLFFAIIIFNPNTAYQKVAASQKEFYQNALMQDGHYVGLESYDNFSQEDKDNIISFIKTTQKIKNTNGDLLLEIGTIYFDSSLQDNQIIISDAIALKVDEINENIKKENKKNNNIPPRPLVEYDLNVNSQIMFLDELFTISSVSKTTYINDKRYNKTMGKEFAFVFLPMSFYERLTTPTNVGMTISKDRMKEDGSKDLPEKLNFEVKLDNSLNVGQIKATASIVNFLNESKTLRLDRGEFGLYNYELSSIQLIEQSGNVIYASQEDYVKFKKLDNLVRYALKSNSVKITNNLLDRYNIQLNSHGYKKYYENNHDYKLLVTVGIVGLIVSLAACAIYCFKISSIYFVGKRKAFAKLANQSNDKQYASQIVLYDILILFVLTMIFTIINYTVFWFLANYIYGIIAFAGAKITMFMPLLFGLGVALATISACFAISNAIDRKKYAKQCCDIDNSQVDNDVSQSQYDSNCQAEIKSEIISDCLDVEIQAPTQVQKKKSSKIKSSSVKVKKTDVQVPNEKQDNEKANEVIKSTNKATNKNPSSK